MLDLISENKLIKVYLKLSEITYEAYQKANLIRKEMLRK